MRKLRVEARAKRVPYELPDLAVRVDHAGDEHLLQNFRAQARLTLAQSGAAAAGSTRRGRGRPGHDAGGSPVETALPEPPGGGAYFQTLPGEQTPGGRGGAATNERRG